MIDTNYFIYKNYIKRNSTFIKIIICKFLFKYLNFLATKRNQSILCHCCIYYIKKSLRKQFEYYNFQMIKYK